MANSTQTYHLLLVDDSSAEVRLMQEAIKDAELDGLVRLGYPIATMEKKHVIFYAHPVLLVKK